MSGTSATSVSAGITDGRRLRVTNSANDSSSATVSPDGTENVTFSQTLTTQSILSRKPATTTEHTSFSTQQTEQDNIFTTSERPVSSSITNTHIRQVTTTSDHAPQDVTISDKAPEIITISAQSPQALTSNQASTSDQSFQVEITSIEATQVPSTSNIAATTPPLVFDASHRSNYEHTILTTPKHDTSATSDVQHHTSTISSVQNQASVTPNEEYHTSTTLNQAQLASTTSNVENHTTPASNVQHLASTASDEATEASTALGQRPLVRTRSNQEHHTSVSPNQPPSMTSIADGIVAVSSSSSVYPSSQHHTTIATAEVSATSETTLTEPSPHDSTTTATNYGHTSTEPTRPSSIQTTRDQRETVLNFSQPLTTHKPVIPAVTTSHLKDNLTDIVTTTNRNRQTQTTPSPGTHKRTTTRTLLANTPSPNSNTSAQDAIWRITAAPADRRMSVLPPGVIDGTTVPVAIVGAAGAFVVCSLLFTLALWIHRWRHSSKYESDYTDPIEAYQRRFSQLTVTREPNMNMNVTANAHRTSVGALVSEGERVSARVSHSYAIADRDNSGPAALPRYVMGYRFVKTSSAGRRHSAALYEDVHGMELVAIPVNQSLPDLSVNSAVFRGVDNGLGAATPAAFFYRETREYERNQRGRRSLGGPTLPPRLERRASGPPVLLTRDSRLPDVSRPPRPRPPLPPLPPPRERRFIPRQTNGRRLPRYGMGGQRWDHGVDVFQWQRAPLDTGSLEGFSVC